MAPAPDLELDEVRAAAVLACGFAALGSCGFPEKALTFD